jgi:tRNA threonylcarbamoyladenosine modification (KEOPS) complex Cgi121 subunit
VDQASKFSPMEGLFLFLRASSNYLEFLVKVMGKIMIQPCSKIIKIHKGLDFLIISKKDRMVLVMVYRRVM